MDRRFQPLRPPTRFLTFSAAIFIWFLDFYISYILTYLTRRMEVNSQIMFFEGLFFAIHYYMKTLDGEGVYLFLTRHIGCILLTKNWFPVIGSVFMSYNMLFYPAFEKFEILVFYTRIIAYFADFYIPHVEVPKSLGVYAVLSYAIYFYYRYYNHKGGSDILIGLTMYCTSLGLGELTFFNLVTFLVFTLFWVFYKSQSHRPISLFPKTVVASPANWNRVGIEYPL